MPNGYIITRLKGGIMMMKVKSNKQGQCPICNGYNLNYEQMELEGDIICYPWKCEDCSAKGEEWYSLNFIGHNVLDEDGMSIEIQDDMIEE